MKATKILLLAAVAIYGDLAVFAQTWTQTSAPTNNLQWMSLVSSADGNQITAVAQTPIYISADSGHTWISNTISPHNWTGTASSSDGTHLFVVDNIGQFYISTNSGGTWTVASGTSGSLWRSVASSADGNKLVAVN